MSHSVNGIELFEVDKPAVARLLDLLREDREVISIFLKPRSRTWPASLGNQASPLAWLLDSEDFKSMCPALGQIRSTTGQYSTLNRLEFEGSLTTILLEGGCHGSSLDMDLGEARACASEALQAAFPAPFDQIGVVRMDDWDWCDFTHEGTIWSSHFACEGARSLVWVLCTRAID